MTTREIKAAGRAGTAPGTHNIMTSHRSGIHKKAFFPCAQFFGSVVGGKVGIIVVTLLGTLARSFTGSLACFYHRHRVVVVTVTIVSVAVVAVVVVPLFSSRSRFFAKPYFASHSPAFENRR